MSHTIAALSTPTGESAIAVIRLSGDLCVEIAKSALSKDVSNSPRHAFFGKYKLYFISVSINSTNLVINNVRICLCFFL